MTKTIAKIGLAALLGLIVVTPTAPAQAGDGALACSTGVESVDRVSTAVSTQVSRLGVVVACNA